MTTDIKYMRRALQLARCGRQGASPNPMVGAVIIDRTGRIIGEGFHRLCGGPHAEVNAVRSVYDVYGQDAPRMLHDATVYVTLEPCAHYGKTPPCAKLLVDEGVRRVVVGCVDPFAKVAGKGIDMLRAAGIKVDVGVLEQECRAINRRFFTAHNEKRPYVMLKWAQSADGFIDRKREISEPAQKFSTVLGRVMVHRLRSLCDAVAVGSMTVIADRPRLDCRMWPGGRKPLSIALDRSGRLSADVADMVVGHDVRIALADMYERGITSVLVEGGRNVLESFLQNGLWDEIRVEISPDALGDDGCVRAPKLPSVTPSGLPLIANEIECVGRNTIYHYVC